MREGWGPCSYDLTSFVMLIINFKEEINRRLGVCRSNACCLEDACTWPLSHHSNICWNFQWNGSFESEFFRERDMAYVLSKVFLFCFCLEIAAMRCVRCWFVAMVLSWSYNFFKFGFWQSRLLEGWWSCIAVIPEESIEDCADTVKHCPICVSLHRIQQEVLEGLYGIIIV